MTAISHHDVHANGLRFHVAQAGPSGPPVLLLHGFPQHSHAWRHVIADLAPDHHVYAPDLRGAGDSEAPRHGYDTATLTADVLALMDALDLSTVALVGHESGGWLGFHLALAAPERFPSLVAVNTPHPWIPHRRMLPHMWRFWYTALFEYPVLGPWLIRTRPGLLRWLLHRGRPGLAEPDVAAFVNPFRDPARARAGQQLQWQMVLHDIPRRMLGRYRGRRLAVPTLLLAGRHDFALSPRSLTTGHNIDVRIVDGGHYLPEEQPKAVSTAVREINCKPTSHR
jgi:pimeloyl-ACP methyl ester carboxylesterase